MNFERPTSPNQNKSQIKFHQIDPTTRLYLKRLCILVCMQFYFTYRGFEKEPTRFWDWECIMWYLYYIILKYEYRTGIKLKGAVPSDCENILDILWWKCTSIEADHIYPLIFRMCWSAWICNLCSYRQTDRFPLNINSQIGTQLLTRSKCEWTRIWTI